MYIHDGVALTVKGEGTLVVNCQNGRNGSDDYSEAGDGGRGSNGESAINGNIIVEGGKVTVTGGDGGKGGYGEFSGGDGGKGGYGIEGNLTVNGGSVTVIGGSGGSGGTTSPVGDAGSNGSNAKAINGNISGATGLVAEESEDGSIWNYITGGSSDRQYVRAKVTAPVKVNVNVGEGHADLFKPAILEQIKGEFSLQEVTLDGNILTLKGVDPSDTEDNLRGEIANFVYNLAFMDNGEEFINVAYKAIDEFATYKDYQDDTHDGKHGTTPVSEGLTYYLLWAKPYEKLEIDNGNPTCGNEWWKAFPTVPDGFMVDPEDSVWRDENGERVGTFEGGKTYTFSGRIYLRSNGALWKYFIDPNNFTLTVKDGKDLEYSLNGDTITLSFKATADHDWDAGTVTKEPTETTEGVKTYKCKHCDATKTEAIPKKGSQDKPAAPKVSTVAATSARAMTMKWTMKWGKVNGAKSYKVAYRKVGSKKWTYKTTKKTKYVVKGHKMRGLYEYKVAAVSKKGTTWSGTSRRYFSGVKTKAKAGKGSIKVSWKKDKTATGYQVLVATNKGMKNYQKFEVGKSAKSYKIGGLKKGKKYYVRVRPMKTHGGVTYKGILSKVKRVRVK